MGPKVVVRMAGFLMAAVGLAAACSHGGAPAPVAPAAVAIDQTKIVGSPPREGPRSQPEAKRYTGIVGDADFARANPAKVVARWLSYGEVRAVLWHAQIKKHAGDDFLMEVMARKVLAGGWAEDRAKGVAPNADLDLMVEVEQAGLLNEYVLASFARPGWTVPAKHLAKLDWPRYRAYSAAHLVGHRPIRPVMFFPKDAPAFPALPGRTLPSRMAMARSQTSCAADHARFTALLAQWAAEEAELDGAPLAAPDRAAFLHALEKVQGVAPFGEHGATWVAPAVADLHEVAGFCAVEEQRWGEAEGLLAKAVSLAPLTPGPYGELAMVYVKRGRLDDADRAVTQALALGPNTCEQARLLRQQGYILVDRGKLLEALHAYGRSLELAPGNPIASHELQVVIGELRRRGGAGAKVAEEYHPPPPSPNAHITSCPR